MYKDDVAFTVMILR